MLLIGDLVERSGTASSTICHYEEIRPVRHFLSPAAESMVTTAYLFRFEDAEQLAQTLACGSPIRAAARPSSTRWSNGTDMSLRPLRISGSPDLAIVRPSPTYEVGESTC
jgi:hypothetical protein